MTDIDYFKSLFDSCDYTEIEFTDGSKQLETINKLLITFDEEGNFQCISAKKLIEDVGDCDFEYRGIEEIFREGLDESIWWT